ncbi:hypothetical protein [Variovorax sp. PCZ-1]|uniref:hypothetical protein n=1 Tax=Variovorax sp. PCZ-1 TaxID=2835533 RepID=UPI001BCB9CE7|nr:hypothetical protein [Variovorax sp. PCZ-1]MBS7807747.1 hypothetical protein [Variovorax sp. PCZ-1]
MSISFTEHRRELVAAIVGASLAGVFSLAVGLYSLTKGFEFTQNKEQLKSLRQDIEFLTRVRSEIDANTQALLGKDHTAQATFSEPMNLSAMMKGMSGKTGSKKQPTAEEQAMLKEMLRQFDQESVRVVTFRFPRVPLVADSWKTSYPEAGDIPFELLSEINEYYRRVRSANSLIDRHESLAAGASLSSGYKKAVEEDVTFFNSQVDELKKIDAIKLKNKITTEISSLSERRKKLALTVEKLD